MAARLGKPNGDRPFQNCSNCRVHVGLDGWVLYWEYGNGRMIFLYYCSIEHLPKNRREEATRIAAR